MRNFQRALLAFGLAFFCAGPGWAQANVETFSAGSGGAYDASDCNDPSIATHAQQLNAVPYHDPNWNTPGDPLVATLRYLSKKYNDDDIDHAYACAHAPGVVFFVPTNRVAEVTKLIGQIEANVPGGTNNGAGGTPSSGQLGGTGANGGPGGPGGPGGSNGNNTPVNGGTTGNGGPGGNRGGPGPNYRAPIPGPAGGIGYTPGPNPCLPKGPGGYDYCQNPSGTRKPPGCYCDGPPPPPQVANRPVPPPAKPRVGGGRPAPAATPATDPNKPLVDTIQYTAGFVNGVGNCVQGLVDLAAGAGWMARGVADLINPTPFHFAQGDEFINAARNLGVQPGQSMILRQIAVESTAKVIGQKSNPYDAATAAGRRFCAFGVVPGVVKAAGGVKTPPARTPGAAPKTPATEPPAEAPAEPPAGLAGASPAKPLGGPALQAAVSEDGTVGSLPGKWAATPDGPVQLGNFVGKGTFGGVFEVAKNPGQVLKIATDNPGSPASFGRQAAGTKMFEKAGVPTAAIDEVIPGQGGQPPMLKLENVLNRPGAFQLTSGGLKRTQASVNARPGNGMNPAAGNAPMQRADVSEINGVDAAVEQLSDQIAGKGMVLGDLHPGNVVLVPKPGGGFNAVVVDADFVDTQANLLKEIGGRTGPQLLQDLANGKMLSPTLELLVNIFDSGGELGSLGPGSTAQSIMDSQLRARQNIASGGALNPRTPGSSSTPTVAP